MKKSLGELSQDLERLLTGLDGLEESNVPQEMLQDYLDLRDLEKETGEALKCKVDNCIGYLDSLKGKIATLQERRDRVFRAYRAAQNSYDGLRAYITGVMQSVSYEEGGKIKMKIKFAGDDGEMYLQHSAPHLGTNYDALFRDLTLRNTLSESEVEKNQELKSHARQVVAWVVDKDAIKDLLKTGEKLEWAELRQGSHMRIKA